jgi:hypothetical protein
MATEVDSGFPRFDNEGGLWILLTVKDVTRPGYGDGANPKEVISDAIRNAAMRFGVALDLWAKEDLQAMQPAPDSPRPVGEPAKTGSAKKRKPQPTSPTREEPDVTTDVPASGAGSDPVPGEDSTLWVKPPGADDTPIDNKQRRALFGVARGHGLSTADVRAILERGTGHPSSEIPQWQYDRAMMEVDNVREVEPS